MGELIQLLSVRSCPETVLHQTLADNPDAVVVISRNKEGRWWIAWSTMELRDLAYASVVLQREVIETKE